MSVVSAEPQLVLLPSKDTVKSSALTIETVAVEYLPIVQELQDWISSDSERESCFTEAIKTATSHNVSELQDIHHLDDYLDFLNDYLLWIPSENVQGKQMLARANKLYFVLNQPSVIHYQSPVAPSDTPQTLTWLSAWMVRYHREMGKYMDKSESFSPATLETFKASSVFNMDDYLEPKQSWKTFNEWFARHHKPGRRPIAGVGDPSVVASPADCRFLGAETVTERSTVTLKGLEWGIAQLLEGSPFEDRFAGGVWMHGFLNVDDYHRIHAPVSGTVVEARVISGQNYSLVGVVSADEKEEAGHVLEKSAPRVQSKTLALLNEPGYQFVQTRGLVVLDMGAAGLVAVLPVAMIAVSSVILTAEMGAQIQKGEELGYFQFGGSDVVLVFESRQQIDVTMEFGQHYKMGQQLGVMRC